MPTDFDWLLLMLAFPFTLLLHWIVAARAPYPVRSALGSGCLCAVMLLIGHRHGLTAWWWIVVLPYLIGGSWTALLAGVDGTYQYWKLRRARRISARRLRELTARRRQEP